MTRQATLHARRGGCAIWTLRILWLFSIAWGALFAALNPWTVIVPGTMAAVLALLMPSFRISFSDLLGLKPGVRRERLLIHPSPVLMVVVGVIVMVAVCGGLIAGVGQTFGATAGAVFAAVLGAVAAFGAVIYWRRRAIIVDDQTVTLRNWSDSSSCDRARVARIVVHYGSPMAYGASRGFSGEGGMELCDEHGLRLLSIPLELFSTREGTALADYLQVPIVTEDGKRISGWR